MLCAARLHNGLASISPSGLPWPRPGHCALTLFAGRQLAALVERCAATETAAARAEQVASAAMAAAEGAVRDEMEAAAVAKETASALDKALTDLQVCRRSGLCGLLGSGRSPWGSASRVKGLY